MTSQEIIHAAKAHGLRAHECLKLAEEQHQWSVTDHFSVLSSAHATTALALIQIVKERM